MASDFDDQYENAVAAMGIFGATLERLISDLLEANDIKPHSIVFRVKSKVSTSRKLRRKGGSRELGDLTDILGVRIITYFKNEVDEIAKIIEAEFEVDPKNSIDKRTALDPDRFGYLSLHYVATLSNRRASLVEYRKFAGLKFELQIRSILQHAWAEIEHDLGYKTEAAVPRDIRRRFSRLAGLLEIADDEFTALRTELADHQRRAVQEIEQGRDVRLDLESLIAFVTTSSRVRDFDRYLTGIDNAPIEKLNSTYLAKRVPDLTAVGFSYTSEVEDYLKDNLRLLQAFSRRWVLGDYPGAERSLAGEDVPWEQGSTVVYVVLLQLARIATKEVGKPTLKEVEKLKQFDTSDATIGRIASAYEAAKGDLGEQ